MQKKKKILKNLKQASSLKFPKGSITIDFYNNFRVELFFERIYLFNWLI